MIDENKIMRPIAVTISGFMIGILLMLVISSLITLLLFERPMAVRVPRIVAINNFGEVTVYYGDDTIDLSAVECTITNIELVEGKGVLSSAVEINVANTAMVRDT